MPIYLYRKKSRYLPTYSFEQKSLWQMKNIHLGRFPMMQTPVDTCHPQVIYIKNIFFSVGPRVCISNKFSSDTHNAGPWTLL